MTVSVKNNHTKVYLEIDIAIYRYFEPLKIQTLHPTENY
jgi:hypothetical protein